MLMDFSALNAFTLYIALGAVAAAIILLVLILLGNKHYSVHDAEAHSTNYAGVIKEGHGPVTVFLWFIFAVIVIWSIVYLIQHWSEFAILFINR